MEVDCSDCKGLCCIWYEFREWDEWIPLVKKAGERCGNLTEDFRCRVQETLKACSSICTDFNCKGIGPELCKQHPDETPEILAYNLVMQMLSRQCQEQVKKVLPEKLPGTPWVKMSLVMPFSL